MKRLFHSNPSTSSKPLKTKEFVEQSTVQLQNYVTASAQTERVTAQRKAESLFKQFSCGKHPAMSNSATYPLDWPSGDKLESLARKLIRTSPYSAAKTEAFFALFHPTLAYKIGVLAARDADADAAARARVERQNLLVRASEQGAALVSDMVAETQSSAQRALTEATQQAETAKKQLEGELHVLRNNIEQLRLDYGALVEEYDALEAKRVAQLATISDGMTAFKAGGATYNISKSDLQKSPYLSALASTEYAEKPGSSGAYRVSNITANQLAAVIEFLEEDKISDLNNYGQEGLRKVALIFGNKSMEAYLRNPEKYYAERKRAAAIQKIGGEAAMPASYALIDAGSFLMGSPAREAGRKEDEVQHTVHLTVPFLLKRTPVTQAEYRALMGVNPSLFAPGSDPETRHTALAIRHSARFFGSGDHILRRELINLNPSQSLSASDDENCPVDNVDWNDAAAYCNALSTAEGLPPYYARETSSENYRPAVVDVENGEIPRGYRLPTEAEWEYAARAGSTESTYGEPVEIAWFEHNRTFSTRPVGQKKANAWGLHDMLGNIWEWTADIYAPLASIDVQDPHAAAESQTGAVTRVIRGGDFFQTRKDLRAATRGKASSSEKVLIGLRPARSVG